MTLGTKKTSPAPQAGESVREATDVLLANPDRIASWLTLADKYMQAYANDPKGFILPREHAFLKPLLEAYAYNLEGFVQYTLGVRDSLDRETSAWESVQAVYRRIMGRHTQQVRRDRSSRAIAKAEELYGEVGFHERLKWVADLEHKWAQRRLAFLDAQRDRLGRDRLNVEERAEFLAEFWDAIDTEISEGKVPSWN